MKPLDRVMIFWGLCDMALIAGMVIRSLTRGELPFIADFNRSLATARHLFEAPVLGGISAGLALALYLSIAVSAFLLLRRKRAAAVLVYLQTPFRLLLVVPSVYAFFWLTRLTGPPPVALVVLVCLVAEVLKLVSVIRWQGAQA